jgi:hypothetical protein
MISYPYQIREGALAEALERNHSTVADQAQLNRRVPAAVGPEQRRS